ncbi:MAG: pyruvate kinase [Bacillus thermozeamaize]|jgi:pyruvate kinase|uniref:Pyruvate kinase n=1 Tax=Bacillus thermozeamaize TaxID=230954 RepID=A0A1Y3PKS2_9BACI|nr:MAG: pyruvate kinase [Bacillus thermozeamaize]
MRKTKIVCTIGPACEDLDKLKQLIKAGMNIARLNLSHGTHQEHRERIARIRQAAKELGKTVGILLDTKGPEIRTGILESGEVELREGQLFTLTTEEVLGNAERVSVSYSGLVNELRPGDTVLLDDGLIGLEVVSVQGTEIRCRVKNNGKLRDRKGVNVPGVSIGLPGITEKDAADIRFGVEQGVDFIAASFVRKPGDILEIHEILEQMGADIPVIAKIESREGVQNLDAILEVADGLMVARGDLGVEIPVEEVPLLQKEMISKCNKVGKPVITATQMLDSMQRNPRPTRAETTDVANAILDGTDAVMLSGETAAGNYPVEAVRMMAKIAETTEKALAYRDIFRMRSENGQNTITDLIGQAVAGTALELKVAAIITPTESGYTARMISKYRPASPIVAVTYNEQTLRRLTLSWGVMPILGDKAQSIDKMLNSAVDRALQEGYISYGDLVVITAGVPIGQVGTTNMMKIHVVGDIIARGQGIGHQVVTGRIVKGETVEEILEKMAPNSILVTRSTDRDMMPAMEKASAIITEQGGLTSHAAIVGLELGIPVIVGVQNAMQQLEDGMEITVDTERGYIYSGKATVL